MPTPLQLARRVHDGIISDVLGDWPAAKTTGFIKALKALPDAEYIQWMAKDSPDWFDCVRFVPDAWMIVPEERHVVVFEAVVSNEVSANKFAKMADMSWALDEDYYRLILVRCDRFGRQAYDVQSASLVSQIQRARAGIKEATYHVPDWQRYDVEYCERFFKQAA